MTQQKTHRYKTRPDRFSDKNLSGLDALLVFVTAFFPRALNFVGSTSIWQQRARAFTEALAQGDTDAPSWLARLNAGASAPTSIKATFASPYVDVCGWS